MRCRSGLVVLLLTAHHILALLMPWTLVVRSSLPLRTVPRHRCRVKGGLDESIGFVSRLILCSGVVAFRTRCDSQRLFSLKHPSNSRQRDAVTAGIVVSLYTYYILWVIRVLRLGYSSSCTLIVMRTHRCSE